MYFAKKPSLFSEKIQQSTDNIIKSEFRGHDPVPQKAGDKYRLFIATVAKTMACVPVPYQYIVNSVLRKYEDIDECIIASVLKELIDTLSEGVDGWKVLYMDPLLADFSEFNDKCGKPLDLFGKHKEEIVKQIRYYLNIFNGLKLKEEDLIDDQHLIEILFEYGDVYTTTAYEIAKGAFVILCRED